MKDLIQAHKKLIKTVKEQMGFSDYGMYWLAFLEGGLTIWLLDRIFFHWMNFYFLFRSKKFLQVLNKLIYRNHLKSCRMVKN